MLLVLAAALLGTFCVDGDCRPAPHLPSRVEPAAHERTFVWVTDEQVVLGIVEQNARRVVRPAEQHPLRVRLSDGVNVPVTIEVASPGRRWTFTSAPNAKLLVVHPSCACTVTARAAEYREAAGALGAELLLRRLPVIRGVVVDANGGAPLARAEVAFKDARTTTADDGTFRIAIDGEWPSSLEVTHPTRAPKLVRVPKAVADTELPPIAMTAGGALQLTIAPPLGGAEPLRWELRGESALVRSGELARGESSARVESLDPGPYRLLVQGREPLQRFARRLTVREGEVAEVTVAIRPVAVERF